METEQILYVVIEMINPIIQPPIRQVDSRRNFSMGRLMGPIHQIYPEHPYPEYNLIRNISQQEPNIYLVGIFDNRDAAERVASLNSSRKILGPQKISMLTQIF